MSEQCVGKVPVGVSNRHLHVSQEDLETLFGSGYELTPLKDLSQPGQYAAEETVTIVTSKGSIQRVRILGPVRPATQIEISRTDAFGLGLRPPVRDSGATSGSAGVVIVGPKGAVTLPEGVILALRHIHMNVKEAESFGLADKDHVEVRVGGERGLTFDNVLVRVRDDFALEFHIDTDEANAAAVNNGELVEVYR